MYLSEVIHSWYVTDIMPYFTGIPPHVRILYIIKRIHHHKEYLRDGVVSKMIEELNGRQILGGFNHN